MGVTIKDIAKHVGVSIMTVSRVVNNSGYVSEDTRRLVETAINEMGYKPNLMARSLINNKSEFISVIVPDIANPFFAELIKGTEGIARKYGYNIILSDTNWTESLEVDHIEGAMSRMADGIVIVAPKLSEKGLEFYNKNIPIVVVDRKLRTRDIPNIFVDNKNGAFAATQHLIELGHRKIAFISGPEGIVNTERRKKGFFSAFKKAGYETDMDLIFPGDFKFEGGKKVFEAIRQMEESKRPSAVFASNDLMALGVISGAIESGWSVPNDLSVVGFDDILLSSLVNPPLTTVSHPYVKMGERAIEELLIKLENIDGIKQDNKLENVLVRRKSTVELKQE